MHRYSEAQSTAGPRAQILASGIAVQWALKAQSMLETHWGVHADIWSMTSWTELRREALAVDAWNHRHPDEPQRTAYVATRLDPDNGPVVAVSDWMRAVPDQIAPFVHADWSSVGTAGFGPSDTRTALRQYVRVDPPASVVRVLE